MLEKAPKFSQVFDGFFESNQNNHRRSPYPDQYTNVLGLDPLNVTPVLVVPIGFRAPDDPFASFAKVRRGIDQVVIDL